MKDNNITNNNLINIRYDYGNPFESNNPLDQFEIGDFMTFELSILKYIYSISITNIGFYLILAGIFIYVLNFLSTNYIKLIGNN